MILAYDFWQGFGEFVILAWVFAIFGIILSFVLGFVCMNIMKKKGYEMPVAWFLLGMFGGIIGLIICLVMQDKSRQVPPNNYAQYPNQPYSQPYQQPYQQPQGVRCQTCGMINPAGSTFCNACGNKMN